MVSRRDFLRAAGLAAASTVVLPRPLLASFGGAPEAVPPIDDPRIRTLALGAVDAARAAGAAYADVRLAHTWTRSFTPSTFGNSERIDVGVRALVQGYWGFASGPVWSPDEMARLGREAVHQARTNTLGRPREVQLAPAPAVTDGRWTTPVKVDAFAVSPFEVRDYLLALLIHVSRRNGATIERMGMMFRRVEKAFASSDGSYLTQRLELARGELVLALETRRGAVRRELDVLSPAAAGYEHLRAQPLRELARRQLDEMERDLALPVKPVDVGRYELLVDAAGVAELVESTLAHPTELDRAMGYEANAGGTSWLNDPLAMLGSHRVGAPLLNVSANRSDPGGAATVRWDDEGVEPDGFTLMKDGVLADFQTTRESAGWLAPAYARSGRPPRSHGCATADSAIFAPMAHVPNLVVAPGRDAVDYEQMLARLATGIAVESLHADVDFQGLSGLATGRLYEVKKGKRVARIANGGLLFRAPELWKGLVALGGPASAYRVGKAAAKGEPPQAAYHSVTAVPALFRDVTVIDPQRKA